MPTMYDLTIPVLTRGLRILGDYMDKAEAYAAARGIEPAVLIGARLAPDMIPLSAQVQRASDTAKASASRLTGVEAPSFADTETSFPELRKRLANTIDFLASVTPAAFEGAEKRQIELKFRTASKTLSGEDYLAKYMIPNFFFHAVTVHGILRHNGVEVGKMDYLGLLE
jgi:uncharacterized protein